MIANRDFHFTILLALGLALATTSHAEAQTRNTTAASRYFGRNEVAMPYQPHRRPKQQPQPMQPSTGKPFQTVYRQPSISPYLSLDLVNDTGTGLPNYYAFYKPQREQLQSAELQEAQIRRLQQQVRTANATGKLSRKPAPMGMPTTGNSSQFMNLGSYFPGLR